MNQKKKVTIYDLAARLNFSPSTISRALNEHKSISKETIRKVKDAAQQLGYRPNLIAANLRNARSSTLGIMMSRINSPFISSLISAIEVHARESGYNVIICQSNDSYENEVANARMLLENQVSGLIVSLSMETSNYDHFKPFQDHGVPVVFVDRVPMEFKSYKVIIDNYTAAFEATEHLISIGCKKIAHFSGAPHVTIYSERKRGYMDALTKHGLPVNQDLIFELSSLDFEEGTSITSQLLKSKGGVDGIFAVNDTLAVAAILCAKEHNVRVPDELSVIGFNDDPIASIVDPKLSTVFHPAAKMGEISAKRIIEHNFDDFDNESFPITVLTTELILRESTRRS